MVIKKLNSMIEDLLLKIIISQKSFFIGSLIISPKRKS